MVSSRRLARGFGGRDGGYIGTTGKWSTWLGCHVSPLAWSSANSEEANANFANHLGIRTPHVAVVGRRRNIQRPR